MCCHLSFVFENRNISASSPEFQMHVSFCQRVLGIYSKSARSPPPHISEVNWNEFLCRIFLGICDEVMRGPADSRSLGNDIEQDVFFCMFDIWLRSQMQNETLWNTLLSMASKEWIHRRWFIESWGQCCVALTRKLIHVLYGGDNGADSVFVFWPVLGTNVISIKAMLLGRPSMIAPTKYGGHLPGTDSNHKYEVRAPNERFGSSPGINGNGDHLNYGKISNHSHHNSDSHHSHHSFQHGHHGHGHHGHVHHSKMRKKERSSPSRNQSNYHHDDGSGGGSSQSSAQSLSMTTTIQIQDNRLLIYLWNCMLNLLDINAINDPECFGCGIAWISRMVDMFLGTNIKCQERREGLLVANGNSILDIFSHELFTAAVNMNGFEEARAIALGGLCRIFVNKCDTIFKSEYLLNFYDTLYQLLSNPNSIDETAREQVILNGATLFACDFDGCRALIAIFLPHIGIILRKPQKPRLRLAAITMLCSFISLEFHFYPKSSTSKSANSFKTSQELRERLKLISNIIYEAIQTENNEYNLQKLLWCCSVFLVISSKFISKSNPFSSDLVRTIWKHIEEEASHWQCHVVTTAFKALADIIENVVSLPHLRSDPVLNHRMFIEMCVYAKVHLSHGTQFDIDSRRVLSVACMKCLLIWAKNDPLIIRNANVSKALRQLIHAAIQIKATRGGIHGHAVMVHHPASGTSGSGGGGGDGSHSHPLTNSTDFDFQGTEPPPLWDTMTYAQSKESTNALKEVYRATDQLSRFFTNDIGSYYQYKRQSACNSPMHRFAEAYLDEQQIEEHIRKLIASSENGADSADSGDSVEDGMDESPESAVVADPEVQIEDVDGNGNEEMEKSKSSNLQKQLDTAAAAAEKSKASSVAAPKWESEDRIRYFAYKKNRIFTVIEMPRLNRTVETRKLEDLKSTSPTLSTDNSNNNSTPHANRKRHQLQHLEARYCDLIFLVRDAYGKYAWEASGIFNDFDIEQEVEDMVVNNPNIIDNTSSVTRGTPNADQFGAIRQDMIARSKQKSQHLAQRKSFHHEETKEMENGNNESSNNQQQKPSVVAEENAANSSAANWSSDYTLSNWRHREQLKNERICTSMKAVITKQEAIESEIRSTYTQYQFHPLKNVDYQQQQEQCRQQQQQQQSPPPSSSPTNNGGAGGLQPALNPKVPFSSEIDTFSESQPHPLPSQDEAATFMHCRRLLSTLGFLRPNQATGVSRFIDILDRREQIENRSSNAAEQLTISDYLYELDAITALDQISVSILYHNDGVNQLSDFDILSSPQSTSSNHSDAFECFVTSMANRVSIRNHVGFRGNLTSSDCDRFPYFSDSICGELAYIVPSELKASLSLERKKKLYLSSCIRIIWSETAATNSSTKNCPLWLSNEFLATNRHPSPDTPIIYIRITAQSHGLYRVSINGESVLPHLLGQSTNKKKKKSKNGRDGKGKKRKSQLSNGGNVENEEQIRSVIGAAHQNTTSIPTTGWERLIIGPLVDGMVISEAVLPDLVRKTVVNASNLITELMDDSLCVDAKERRERLILEIATKFEKFRGSERHNYYKWFFVNPGGGGGRRRERGKGKGRGRGDEKEVVEVVGKEKR